MLPRLFGNPFGILLFFCTALAFVAADQLGTYNWVNEPINCYTCDSIQSCAASKGALRKCEHNDEQTCVVLFDRTGAVAKRGCSDDVAASYGPYCNANPENCLTCSSSGCNDATSLEQYVECIACDSAFDKNCLLEPNAITTKKMCHLECMTALYPVGEANNSSTSSKYHLLRSCLNDLELDERVECRTGLHKNCAACEGPNCNLAKLGEERLKCYHCTKDCDDPEVQECIAYHEDDQCYVLTDSVNNDVIEMGCLSAFDNLDEIVSLTKQKLLYKCGSNNCNGYEQLPDTNECTKCSTDTNENCAIAPSSVLTTRKCNQIPYRHCYERVDNATGGTERGCLFDLDDDEFYDCLTGQNRNCKVCLGNGCNNEIVPANRLRCQRCNSISDPNCLVAPEALSVCPTYNEDDTCVSLYENGVVSRGCGTELSCNKDAQNCDHCSITGCNTVDIKKRSEEIYGVFQALPLNCNTCNGTECLSGTLRPRKCEGIPQQDCMSVFNTNGVLISRGCEVAVETDYASYCAANPALCFKCKSNGCNTLTDPNNYKECIYCDAATNPDCLFNPDNITTRRKCVHGCISSLYPRKSDPNVYDFVRTCYEDIENDDRGLCTPANNCVRCEDSNGCNKAILPVEGRLSCLHCSGTDCNQLVSRECIGYAAEDRCFMYFDNITFSATHAGCLSELHSKTVENDIKQYFLCDGDNCNDYANLPDAKLCYTCDSAKDLNCAVNGSAVTTISRCQNYPYTDCYTRVRSDGHTERGCLINLPTSDFTKCNTDDPDGNCKICSNSQCNDNVFPSNRQRCYRCNSLDDPNCENAPTNGQACPLYVPEDTCITKLVNGITQRGCGSEMDCLNEAGTNCLSCTGNNCNNVILADEDIGPPGMFQSLPLNCYHCDNDVDCWISLGLLRKCQGNILQTCTTAFAPNGGVLQRGCSNDLESICSKNGNTCFDCKSNGCNTADSKRKYIDCVFCDAQKNSNCANDVSSITRTRKCNGGCMSILYPVNNATVPAYELLRTCLDDLDLDDSKKCVDGELENCKACTEPKCNIDDFESRLSCYHCQGDNCQNPQIQQCRAAMANDQCLIAFNEKGGVVAMGCKSEYDEDELKIGIIEQRLWLCDGPNCNTYDNLPSAQPCAICSSRTDADCAVRPDAIQSVTNCAKVPFTQCYSRVLASGHTERGCISSLVGDEYYDCLMGSSNCKICTGGNCNKEVYPSGRRSCHVCSSITSADCETSANTPQVCLLYSPNEQCVTSIDEHGVTQRGCRSSVSCDANDTANCRLCDGDNCNNSNIKRKSDGKPGQWQALPLSCNVCNNEGECSSTNMKQETCSNEEYCMTIFNTAGQVAMRGCSEAVESRYGSYCDMNSDNCFNCNSNNCNTATSLSNYIDCIYCDSMTNENCVVNPSGVTRKRKCNQKCMTALWPRANSSAFELVRSCLDDKDASDQLSCNDEHCVACNGAKCNNVKLPEVRLSCYKCDDCEDFEAGVCQAYRPDDQCYILFDSSNNIERMGCLSDLDDDYIANNINMLYTCDDGDLCNNQANTPTPQICIACNSNDDVDCAIQPNEVPTVTKCSTLPNTQCYTRYLSDGATERGCVSSLKESEMLNCLAGNATSNCVTCKNDRCNVEIFPADRRVCQRCNSKDDSNCASSTNAASVCPRYVPNDGCSVKLVLGQTYRGCSSEFTCDDSDKQYCRNCATDNCNTADLASNAIGYPGKWQTTPISCYNCTRSECSASALGSLNTCENNDLQNCVTVFDKEGVVVQRGCSDNIYASTYGEWCDQQKENCQFCKSNRCNVATSLNDYVDCISCDAVENADCISNPTAVQMRRRCYKGCLSGMYPRTAEENPAYELSRGCADDLEEDDQVKCGTAAMPLCEICHDDNCNTAQIVETQLSCYFCADEDCKTKITNTCTSYRADDKCYTFFAGVNDTILGLGCLSDLDNSFIQAHLRFLLPCDGSNCNTVESYPKDTSCKYCNSTKDIECVTMPGTSDAVVCMDLPYTHCYSKVFDDGRTERGCLQDLATKDLVDCLNSESVTCEICSSNNCNNQIYPAKRRSCLRCDSTVDANCENNPSEYGGLCPMYAANDECVTKLEGERTIRGCASELTCDASDTEKCSYCSTDNCNGKNLQDGSIGEPGKWQELPLNCYKCSGAACLTGTGLISKCEGNNKQNCMVVFEENGSVIKRDCSDAVSESHADYCAANPQLCVGCKSNGCNNYNSVSDFIECYFCDSAESTSCTLNLADIKRRRKCKTCMVGLYPRSSSNDTAYELSRSCLDDLDIDDQEDCMAGSNPYCKACNAPLCNSMVIPEDRFECYKCSGDCELPEIETCTAYHPNDQCYMLFDSDLNSIISMGCRSEFETLQVTELVRQKKLKLCDGKACNEPSSVPTPKQCKLCNSEEDTRCATNPNLVSPTTRCSVFPYTECYTLVNENGATVRGCLASLSDDNFYQCLIGNDTLCSVCSDNNCNGLDVFPSNRLKCHQCDSLTDPNCATSPNSNNVCVLYDANDACVTTLRNDVTIRGCASSVKCENPADRRTCRKCDTPACNTQDLTKENVDGQPGRWQTPPLTCHTCKGEDVCSASLGPFRVCEKNPSQNCMTVFNGEGAVIQRGCSDIVDNDNADWCDANPNQCKRCNSNGCNIAKSLDEYVDCLVCDTTKNTDCVHNVAAITQTRQCRANCMTAMYRREKEDNPAYVLARDCYDELDLDDRDACADGTLQHCSTCSTGKCNTMQIPEKRLSCYQCVGDDCQMPEAKECPFYREQDVCYIRFDERQAIVSQGCRSEFTNSEADFLLSQKSLYLCADNNCNDIDLLPMAQECTLCSSRTDVNCAVEPEAVKSATNCAKLPYTHCYSRVLNDGATERGCLQSLYDDDFVNCLGGNSNNCTACLGAKCNNKLFPENRLSCHSCDSLTDPDCESMPNSLSVCSKYEADDMCVTSFANERTIRGCASSVSCDATNPRGCSKCQGNGCNIINLAENQDDNFGKWQDLPLKCWSCEGAACNDVATSQSLLCENNNEQDCVTVFDDSGKVVKRGCSDAVKMTHGSYCNANKDDCLNCKSNNCNSATSKSDFVECIYCDSSKNRSCVWDPMSTGAAKTRWCQGGCMTALYPSDGSANPAYDLIRTCLNDKEPAGQTSCTNSKDAQCLACMEGQCNTAAFPADRHSCYSCESETCETPQAQLCPLYKPNDKCFIWFDNSNSISQMGCVSSFRNQDLESIIKTKRILTCDGVNCNVPEIPLPQKCAACTTEDDILCAVNAKEVGSFATCNQLPYTNCYSRLLSDGNTVRGCLTDLPGNEFAACLLGNDTNCSHCLGEGCNREIFPADRLQCYSCTSEDDENCESEPMNKSPCRYVRDSETCISALSGNMTVRGCSSLTYCDSTESKTCRSCGRTGCNAIDLVNKVYDTYHGYWQPLPLKCHTCDGEHCLNSLGPALTCQRNSNQDCMTVFNASGVVISRGCEDDVEDYYDQWCRHHPDHCYKCKSNECNDVWDMSDYVQCVFCDSETDPLCAVNPENAGFAKRSCNRECLVSMRYDEIIRSCLDDKEIMAQPYCRDTVNSTECASCDSANCNTFIYPADRLSCHICTGQSCSSSVAEYCRKYDSDDFCFAKFENGKVDLMGCASAQNESDIEKWKAEKKLYDCKGRDCNDLTKLPGTGICVACDSSKTPNCAQNPLLVDSFESCALLSNECVTWIDDANHTLRACLSSVPQAAQQACIAAGTCAVCTGEKCNTQIYPAGRRKCHRCNSASDETCTAKPNALQICPIYAANDRCVSKKLSNNSIQRGCVSDNILCSNEAERCETCPQDGCNTVDLTGNAPLTNASFIFTILLACLAILSNPH